MENLLLEVVRYVNGVVQERLGNDPIRLNAYWNLVAYLDDNPGLTASQRHAMISHVFGNHNQDLAQVLYTYVQDAFDDFLLNSPPQVEAAKLFKVGMMCFCIQFMDLFRRSFSVHEPYYTTLSNVVHLYTIDQVSENQLRAHINYVLYHFPDFRYQLQARITPMTSLFFIANPPGPGNPPPPQV